MTEPSQLYRLIEERLPGTFADLIAQRRPHTPWRAISREVTELTGITVSWETLRGWFADRIEITTTVRVA